MLNYFSNLEAKEQITLIGIVATTILSSLTLIITLKNNRKLRYINSITNERLESMSNLKLNVSELISILKDYLNKSNNEINFKDTYKLKLRIEFQLNSERNNEKYIINKMKNIFLILEYKNRLNYNISIKNMIEELEKLGLNMHSYPGDYLSNNSLTIETDKKYLDRLIRIEVNLLEEFLKQHIKKEWEKVKSEINK